ncbi:acetyl-CoA synthetase-like protein [Mycena metata]|uniref:Acetyl-CoA synthetase-like protein n=1 Tax=Mycena metata TaxID=1033252 RepID=A0AAD7NP37_9AGAR|nr:acetyl-CoA synthetase-like protein [Mycena metata]
MFDMTLIHSGPTLVPPPDDLTVPQFFLDGSSRHVTQPERLVGTPCLIDDDSGQKVMLEELRERTRCLANALKFHWNIGEGTIVTIISPNHIDYGPCVWAIHRLGGIVATLGPMLTSWELVHHFKIAMPSIIFVHSDCLSSVLQATAVVGLQADRIVMVDTPGSSGPRGFRNLDVLIHEGSSLPQFTERALTQGEAKSRIAFLAPSSGTTGTQKVVAISHFNVISIVIQSATFNRINEPYAPGADRFRRGDISTGFLPLYHIYGLVYNLHYMIYAGLTLVLTPKFNFENFLASIERNRITHLTLVPPQAVLLCKHPAVKRYDLSSVRYCIVAAAPLSATLTQELLEILPNVHLGQGYGLTETCGTVGMFPLTQKIGTLGSGGQLLPGTFAKVVKPDGTLAKEPEVGELYVKGGQVALGYYDNEQATKETFIDGWLKTGDQVYFQNGDIFVIERIKELIKVKGLQVAPAELEGHLLTHPSIFDCAVIGVADEYSGELPMAFIVLQPELATAVNTNVHLANDLRSGIFKHVADVKSRHKWLAGGVRFTNAIPRNPSGKILRRLLRAQLNDSPSAGGVRARL